MEPRRIRRLPDFTYNGSQRYSLTICAKDRQLLFVDDALVKCVVTHFLAAADRCKYEVIAYCVMPDHMHVVATGTEGGDDLDVFVKRAKQLSGYYGKRIAGRSIWQDGYYDRVLRDSEDLRTVVAYILNNPVRKGLVRSAQDYPYSGSGVYGLAELFDFIQIRPT